MKYYILIVLFVILSCDNVVKKNHDLLVNLDIVIKKNDSIQVFYTTDGTINFNEPQSFWVKVKGTEKNQTVELAFPKDTVPRQFRIDLGRNPRQDDIVLNRIELSYKDQLFEMKGKEIYKYFWLNDAYATLDKKTGFLKRKPGQINGPSLYPNSDNLKNKLKELTSGK